MKLKQLFISIHGPKHYSGKHFQEGSIKNNIENLKLKMFSLQSVKKTLQSVITISFINERVKQFSQKVTGHS